MVSCLLGLTGGIGSGKSAVGHIIETLGAFVVDADQLARAVVAPGTPALAAIVARWGETILGPDASLDRLALARIVFADPEERRALEAITHPRILAESERLLAASDALIGVHMAALLIEAGASGRCEAIWVVTAPTEVRIARVAARDHLDAEAIEARLSHQMADHERIRWADRVIDNSGTLEDLAAKVRLHFADLEYAVQHDEIEQYRRAEKRGTHS